MFKERLRMVVFVEYSEFMYLNYVVLNFEGCEILLVF